MQQLVVKIHSSQIAEHHLRDCLTHYTQDLKTLVLVLGFVISIVHVTIVTLFKPLF